MLDFKSHRLKNKINDQISRYVFSKNNLMVDNLSVDLKRFTVSTYIKLNYKDKQACLVISRKNEALSSECLNET